MRCLSRNKTVFYFAKYEKTEETYDKYGNLRGTGKNIYSTPIRCKGNVSSAKGEVDSRAFGDDVLYDKTIVLSSRYGIDEYSILWVDTLPTFNDDGSTDTPHDYIVKRIAQSLNSVTLAIGKVNVSV